MHFNSGLSKGMSADLTIARDTTSAPRDIFAVYEKHKKWLQKKYVFDIPQPARDVLRALAANPQVPESILFSLLPLFSDELKSNPVFDLLGLENPNWFLKYAPSVNSPGDRHRYNEFMSLMVAHKLLRFTGHSYSWNSPFGRNEFRLTIQGPTLLISRYGENWFPSLESAMRAADARLTMQELVYESKVDLLGDIKSYLAEERGDTEDLRSRIQATRAKKASREDCSKQSHSKGHGTYKYPYAWHSGRQGCEPIPVHVAADSTEAHEKSGKAERGTEGKPVLHMKASKAHAEAYHIAHRAGYHDLAKRHKEMAEKHRDQAVELSHPNAKEDLHRHLSAAIHPPADKPIAHKEPASRGKMITRQL